MCMYKNNIFLIIVILLLGVVGNALAAYNQYSGTYDGDWNTGANWDLGHVPTNVDKAGFKTVGGPLVVTSTPICDQWTLGGVSGGIVTIDTGGSVETIGRASMAQSSNEDGTLVMNGGTATFGGMLDLGYAGTGHIDLNGGTIDAADFRMRELGGVGTMDIHEGTLIIGGDKTTLVNSYISSGWITAYDDMGTVSAEYNGANPGKTTVTATEPTLASNPNPANGGAGVGLDDDLSWTAGIYAVSHDVYFGTDSTPDATEFMGNQPGTTFEPGTMDTSTTYYWRIDEINTGNPESPWIGQVWSFETHSGTATLKKGPYITYPGDNTEMQVLWQLDESMPCSIEWGTDTTYSDGNANTSEYGDDHQHKYTITGLTPGSKYFYKVTVGAGYETGSFRAAPSASATDVKFMVYGDTRSYPSDHSAVCAAIVNTFEADPDYQTLILHDGDFVNAGVTEIDWAVEFFDPAQLGTHEMLGNLPLNGAQGNHERQSGGAQNEGWLYLKYWPYPYVGGYYWSFDYGPVHIAVVDEYTSYSTGSAQLTWLENDLATTNKPWKFIISHEPGWSAGGHPDNTDVQTYIQPLCETYGVDIYFAGHNHYYARCGVNGVKHITTGGGGAGINTPNPNYTQYVEVVANVHHFCKIDIVGDSLTFSAVETDGTVIDTFMLGNSECGDATCDLGEDQCNCPGDCGTPPSTETNCTDGDDNDCDTYTDCDDADCDTDPACSCGNGVCDPGEDCNSCSADCISKVGGKPSSRYCCGDGTCEGAENETNCAVDCGGGGSYCDDGTCDPGEDECNCPEDCGTPPSTETTCDDGIDEDCDSDTDCDDADCLGDPACPSCGDATCDSGEDQCNCPGDCGTPPATETNCTDGINEDCDADTDCDDSDCVDDPACDCGAKGEPCSDDADCCSTCNTRKGTCK